MLLELIDFDLILFFGLDEDKIVTEQVFDSPENRLVESSHILDYFSQVPVVNYFVLDVEVGEVFVDDLKLFFSDKFDAVFKVEDSLVDLSQADLKF